MVSLENLEPVELPILIICRHLQQSDQLLREISCSKKRYIVASDDIRIHRLAASHPNVERVSWICQMDTLFKVSDKVVAIIDSVNNWYKNEANGHSFINDLLFWPKHCEGGAASQIVLDFLLLEKSYEALFDLERLGGILIINDATATWENDILLGIAHQREVPAKVIGRLFLKSWLRKYLWLQIRPFAVAVFRTLMVLRVYVRYFKLPRHCKDDMSGHVAIQLVGSSKNHHNHTKELAEALRGENLDPIILGWQLYDSAGDLQNNGFKVAVLERYLRLCDIFSAWHLVISSRWRSRRAIRTLLSSNNHSTNPQVLNRTLGRLVKHFYFNELLSRVLLKSASRRYFANHEVSALRPWTQILPEGIILYNEFRRILPDAIVFNQGGWPYNLPQPIADSNMPIPQSQVTYFACSDLHRKILINKGFCSKNVIVSGLHWGASIRSFAKTSKQESRGKLNLSDARMFILLDTNSVLLGYQTAQEQISILSMMLSFAKKNPDCLLMIKPHPSSMDSIVNELIIESALENVILIEKSDLPYHAINAADILITKISTMALEAMFLNVPTIGAVLDGERAWEIYGDAVEYQRSLPGLQLRLQELIDNSSFALDWQREMRLRHRCFFKEHGIPLADNPSQAVAMSIKERIIMN